MSVTAKEVFIAAMKLMNEPSQDGTYEGYSDDYRSRAWGVLNILLAELTPASTAVSVIASESTVLPIDDRSARTILPYGLAAHFLMDEENDQRAAFFNARYDELKRRRPAKIRKITDVYANPEESSVNQVQPVELSEGAWDGGEF